MKTRTKLAMIISTFSVGGGQKVVLDLLKAINKGEFEVKLFVHSEATENQFTRELREEEIEVEFVPRDARVSFGSYKRLSDALKRFSPDVVHIHLDTLYAPLWAVFHKTKTVFTVHSQAFRAFNSKILVMLHSYLAKRKHYRITAVSDTIAKETEELLGLSQGSVAVIYNPVAIPPYFEKPETHKVKFVNVARFQPVKNHKLLLKAFSGVLQEEPDAELYLAGDGELQNECKEYARDLQISSGVHFLGNVENVSELLNGSDVFVLSSDSEALPISVLEAMAHGLPIVSTCVGGVPDIVKDNGILVPKSDDEALSRAMLEMAGSAEKRKEMGKRSYELVQRFDIKNIVSEYGKLY